MDVLVCVGYYVSLYDVYSLKSSLPKMNAIQGSHTFKKYFPNTFNTSLKNLNAITYLHLSKFSFIKLNEKNICQTVIRGKEDDRCLHESPPVHHSL